MTTLTRQPFAPLDGARLQTLTSLKNKQNAISPSSSGKRKAGQTDLDDSENLDPILFAKRAKGLGSDTPSKDVLKKPALALTLGTSTTLKASPPTTSAGRSLVSPTKRLLSTPRRSTQDKSPASRVSNSAPKPTTTSSVPAGRSPTALSKRSGTVPSSRRRTLGCYTRIDPPSSKLAASAAPFSLDAALKGTIPGYAPRPAPAAAPAAVPVASCKKPSTSSRGLTRSIESAKSSWFFDIHEDTPEQEMTNLLQHSTCVLDISSDEESERRASRDKAEGRNKENIPPVDHVSQASTRRASKASPHPDAMLVEEQRVALGEMNATNFYPDGCNETSVILILEEDEDDVATVVGDGPGATDVEAHPKVQVHPAQVYTDAETEEETEAETEADELSGLDLDQDIDFLISRSDSRPSTAAVLQPIEGAGESFELWESDSTKDENEAPTASS